MKCFHPTFPIVQTLCIAFGFVLISCRLAYSQGGIYISGYDIQNAVESGSFAGWNWNYNGNITPTGTMVITVPDLQTTAVIANYTGSGGILDDGFVSGGPNGTELFATFAQPVITIHLGGTYAIQSINLESFSLYNEIPGNISGVNVSIGGTSANMFTFTTKDDANNLCNSLIDVTDSSLEGSAGNTIILSGFNTMGSYSSLFCIGQIIVTAQPVPEPSSGAFIYFGMVIIALFAPKTRCQS